MSAYIRMGGAAITAQRNDAIATILYLYTSGGGGGVRSGLALACTTDAQTRLPMAMPSLLHGMGWQPMCDRHHINE